jgi:pyroglutamyl-peptidase
MDQPLRILLYGFGPYLQYRDNITAKILRLLPRRRGLRKVVFPVRFDRRQFIEAIRRTKPDIVLGLGQSSRQRIEIERQAANRRRTRPGVSSRHILPSAPQRLLTTLRLRIGGEARRSTEAGDYVCNFSMYVMLDHIRRKRLDIHYGFIHIPHDYDVLKATRLVEKIVGRLFLDDAQASLREDELAGLGGSRVSSGLRSVATPQHGCRPRVGSCSAYRRSRQSVSRRSAS